MIIDVISILGICIMGWFIGGSYMKFILEEERQGQGRWKSGELVDGTWTCPQCGAFNAKYLVRCGKCFNPKTEKTNVDI
jgi:ribosomal protein S27AE